MTTKKTTKKAKLKAPSSAASAPLPASPPLPVPDAEETKPKPRETPEKSKKTQRKLLKPTSSLCSISLVCCDCGRKGGFTASTEAEAIEEAEKDGWVAGPRCPADRNNE